MSTLNQRVFEVPFIITSGNEFVSYTGTIFGQPSNNMRDPAWRPHTVIMERRCAYCGNKEPKCGCGKEDYIWQEF